MSFELDCSQRVDVAIVVDTSSSVSRRNFDIVKTFLNQLVSGLPVSYRMAHVSVIRYNHKSYLDWDFRSNNAQYLPDLKKAIGKLRYRGGGTRTDKAMEMAAAKVFKSSGGSRSICSTCPTSSYRRKNQSKVQTLLGGAKTVEGNILQPRSEGSNPCLSGVKEGRVLRDRGCVPHWIE